MILAAPTPPPHGAKGGAECEHRARVLHGGARDGHGVGGGGARRVFEPELERIGGRWQLAICELHARVHEEQLAQHPLVVRAVGLGAPRVELLKRRLELPLHDLAARRTPKRSEHHAFWKVVSENIYSGLVF